MNSSNGIHFYLINFMSDTRDKLLTEGLLGMVWEYLGTELSTPKKSIRSFADYYRDKEKQFLLQEYLIDDINKKLAPTPQEKISFDKKDIDDRGLLSLLIEKFSFVNDIIGYADFLQKKFNELLIDSEYGYNIAVASLEQESGLNLYDEYQQYLAKQKEPSIKRR
jgi:hypothetical protein